jgi:hypothetical protein
MHPVEQADGSERADETASRQNRQMESPIPRKGEMVIETAGDDLKHIHEVSNHDHADSQKKERSVGQYHCEEGANEHSYEDDLLFGLDYAAKAWPGCALPESGICGQEYARERLHVSAVEMESQQRFGAQEKRGARKAEGS